MGDWLLKNKDSQKERYIQSKPMSVLGGLASPNWAQPLPHWLGNSEGLAANAYHRVSLRSRQNWGSLMWDDVLGHQGGTLG